MGVYNYSISVDCCLVRATAWHFTKSTAINSYINYLHAHRIGPSYIEQTISEVAYCFMPNTCMFKKK